MILKDDKEKRLEIDENFSAKVMKDDQDQELLADEEFLNAIVAGLEEMNDENKNEKDEEDALLKEYGF